MCNIRYQRAISLGVLVLLAGCAQPMLPPTASDPRDLTGGAAGAPAAAASSGPAVFPVYRVDQPAGSAAGQYAVGRIDLAHDRIDAAIERFRQALALDPGHVDSLNGLAIAYGAQGRFEEAARMLQRALERTPDAAHLLNNLGFAQMKAGRLDEAWHALKRAFGLEPYDSRTRQNLRLLAAARHAAGLSSEQSPKPGSATPGAVAAPALSAALAASADLPAPRAPASVFVELSPNHYELRVAPAPHEAAGLMLATAPATAIAADRGSAVLEVSNGVGVTGLAGRTARRLSGLGMQVGRLTDVRGFGRQQSELLYRAGFLAQAESVQRTLPIEVRLLRSESLHARIDIRLVIGRDLANRPMSDQIKLSSAETDSPSL